MTEITGLFWDIAYRFRRSISQFGQQSPQDNLFFLHIPKCGGTSLVSAMSHHYTSLNPSDDQNIGHLSSKAALRAATILGQDPVAYYRDILLYYLAQDYRFVSGHFAFNIEAYKQFHDKYAFVTMLRDPVKKWFSLFFFNRYKEGDHYAIDQDLEVFIETETAVGYGCDYAMQFAGDDTIEDFASREAIDRAIENLTRFDLVGVLEDLPLFIQDFESLFSVQLKVRRLRSSPVSKEFRENLVSPEIWARVEELNRPNLAIYQYVVDHLIGRMTPKLIPAQGSPQ